MLTQLQANKGKKISLELANGRIISGMLLDVSERFVRMGTEDGVGTIPVSFVQIIWETQKRSLTDENMEDIARKLRDSVKAEYVCTGPAGFNCPAAYVCIPPHVCISFACPGSFVDLGGGPTPCVAPFIGYECTPAEIAGQSAQGDAKTQIACTAFPGFSCVQQYICRPPDICTTSFACPGSYVPGFPQGGGGCPFFACGPFQFRQPCGPFQFRQPCGPFQFGQPCGPFQFGQPCGPFQFGGSQCGVPGGFICPGQQFIGVAGPPTAPMAKKAEVPLPPMEILAKKDDQSKDSEKAKE